MIRYPREFHGNGLLVLYCLEILDVGEMEGYDFWAHTGLVRHTLWNLLYLPTPSLD